MAKSYRRFEVVYCLLLESAAVQDDNWCILELLELEDGDIMIFGDVGESLPKDTTWRITRLESSPAPLWEPQISQRPVISHKSLCLWVNESRSVYIVTGFCGYSRGCFVFESRSVYIVIVFYGYSRGWFASDWVTFRLHCYRIFMVTVEVFVGDWVTFRLLCFRVFMVTVEVGLWVTPQPRFPWLRQGLIKYAWD
jgi:hypothetical protein